MTTEINAHNTPRDSETRRADVNKRIEKLEIQVNCLRKQVLDLEGKKPYKEQANDKVHPRQQRIRSYKEE